jgi:hypothetical protein
MNQNEPHLTPQGSTPESAGEKALREIYNLSGNDSIGMMIEVKNIARKALKSSGEKEAQPATTEERKRSGECTNPMCARY